MSTRALRIWEHGEVEVVQLPGTHAAQIRERLSGRLTDHFTPAGGSPAVGTTVIR